MTRPYFKSRQTALGLGYGLGFAAIFCLRDAYERRNVNRPWWSIFIPGA